MDWAPVDRGLRVLRLQSVISLLASAADSPGGGHRLPSLALLWARAVGTEAHPGRAARLGDLPRLVSSVRRTAPAIGYLEDFWPCDPRYLVRFPLGTRRLAIHPGAYTNPVRDLRVLWFTAQAIDPFLEMRLGFGLQDLMNAALTYMDATATWRRARWPEDSDGLPMYESPPRVETLQGRARRISRTPAQIGSTEIGNPPAPDFSTCLNPTAASMAWAWARRPAREPELDLERRSLDLGPGLAFEGRTGTYPLPASLVLDGLLACSAELVALASRDRPSKYRLQALIEGRWATFMGQGDGRLGGDAAALGLSPKRALMLGVVSGLEPSALQTAGEKTLQILRKRSGSVLKKVGVSSSVKEAVVTQAVVYGGPFRAPLTRRPGTPWMHIEDLIEFGIETDHLSHDLGGRLLLWNFLEDLAAMPGVAEILSDDIDDVWRIWLSEGTFNPTGLKQVAVVPDPVPDQHAWVRWAMWEPVEQVLSAARLPPSWEWPITSPDEDPGEATLASGNLICKVLGDPPLIITSQFDPSLASIRQDPAVGAAVAEGVRRTIAGSPEVAAAFRALAGPVRLDISASPTVPKEAHSKRGQRAAVFGLTTSTDPLPTLGVLLLPGWFDLLLRQPDDAHGALGSAFALGLAAISQVDPKARAEFEQAWRTMPPIMRLHLRPDSLPIPERGRDRLPRNIAVMGKARRHLAVKVMTNYVKPGLYAGRRAARLANERLAPLYTEALLDVIQSWSGDAIDAVSASLNDAHAERYRQEVELSQALTQPWGQRWREAALQDPEPSRRTRPLEILLEALLIRPPRGRKPPDKFDIALAAEVAGEALEMGLAGSAMHSSLHGLRIRVDPTGRIHMRPAAQKAFERVPGGVFHIDVRSYIEALRSDQTRLRGVAQGTTEELPNDLDWDFSDQEFLSVSDVTTFGSLLQVEEVLRRETNTSISAVAAVLGTAVTWTGGSDALARVKVRELAAAAAGWSQLPLTEIRGALHRLMLDSSQMRAEPFAYWEQERRRFRLATRPLVRHRGDLIVIPRLIQATQRVYANYLEDGRLPWHRAELPKAVDHALQHYRQVGNDHLARQAAEAPKVLGLPHRLHLEKHIADRSGMQLPGEIDLLVADPVRLRIWVCEVKDLAIAVSPSRLAEHVKKFLEPQTGFVSKLQRKQQAVLAGRDATLRLLRLSNEAEDWHVFAVMVTRMVEPAAFANGPKVTFVTATDLTALLDTPDAPELGYWSGNCQ